MDEIAKETRNKREKKGSINFNKKEVYFKLNEKKEPVGVYTKESKDANKLIEEFMLIANKKVAELFTEIKKQKYIYRVHDLPDNEKLKSLKHIVKSFGYTLDLTSSKGISNSLNKLLPVGKKFKKYLPFFIGFKLLSFTGFLTYMMNR